MERSPFVELSPQEAMALIQIANAGGVRAGTVSESDMSRLHLLGLVEQPNLPGTIDEHPNWRRRLGPPARELFEAPAVRARVDLIRGHRR